jgi:exodeoxyribonuclease VII small subunit
MTEKESLSFEEAHEQLEKILAAMNGGKVSLEELIALFEKGEKLMRHCEKQLQMAQLKIDQILKDRNGEALLNPDQTPKTASFAAEDVPF